jgi:hypothetical protein
MHLAAHIAFALIFIEGSLVLFFPEFVKKIMAGSSRRLLQAAAIVEIILATALFILYSLR